MSKNGNSIFDFINDEDENSLIEILNNKNNNIINSSINIWEDFDMLDSKIKALNNDGDYEPLEFNLPKHFFEDIINYEIDLSEDFTLEKLNLLIKQYSIAIQFYLENEPQKAKAYQNRMEYLLTDKEILLNLKKEKNENYKSQSTKQLINKSKAFKIIKNNYMIKSEDIKKLDIKDKVNDVINDKDIKNNKQNITKIIENEVKKQNQKWKQKLVKKKENKNKLFMTPNPSDERINLIFKGNDLLSFNPNKKEKNKYNEINEDSGEESDQKENNNDNNEINDIEIIKQRHNNRELDNAQGDKSINENIIKKENNIELNKSDEVEDNNEYEENLKNKHNIIEKIQELDKNTKIEEDNKIGNNIILKESMEEFKNTNNNIKENSIINKDNIIKNIEPDEEIIKIIYEKMNIINNINIDKEEEDENNQEECLNINNIINNTDNNSKEIETIPYKFKGAYLNIGERMNNYIIELKKYFYNAIFGQFYDKLKELYDLKYKKYIEIKNEYHASITENEFLLENEENLNENKKKELIQIIESLKEELQLQIYKIDDEFNGLINTNINEFKLSYFKIINIQLIEEQLKLDIYSIINEAFY